MELWAKYRQSQLIALIGPDIDMQNSICHKVVGRGWRGPGEAIVGLLSSKSNEVKGASRTRFV